MRRAPDSRIVVPPLPPRHTSRARLLRQLDEATTGPLTVLSAGPGTGKTALLSEWCARAPYPVAWVSLSGQENDPRRFWPLVAAAMTGAGLAGRTDYDELASRWPELDVGEHLDGFFQALGNGDERFALVLDDAHELTDPQVLGGLRALVRQRQDDLVLILSARSDPVLPLHRYRLAGLLSEIRADDLRMTSAEAAAVLAAHGVTLTARSLEALTARTEGWVAGIRLSAISMAGHPRPGDLVTELAMDTGSVGEYLTQEVLSQLTPDARALLIRTGFLREITADLAAVVSQVPGAGRILEELSGSNSFVIPLDREQTTYRYHHLLAEILRHLLHREPRAERRALVRRAIAWYVDAGRVEDALRVALEFDDWAQVGQLLVEGGFLTAFTARTDLEAARLSLLDHDDGSPPVALALAALHARTDPTAVRRHLAAANPGDPRLQTPRAMLTRELVELLLARTERRQDDVERLSERLLARSEQNGQVEVTPDIAVAVTLERAASLWWTGRHGELEQLLLAARSSARAHELAHLELEGAAQLSLACAYWGRVIASRTYEREATRLVRQSGALTAPATLHLAASVRCLFQADLVGAAAALRRAARASTEPPVSDLGLGLSAHRAMLLVAAGRPAEARPLLQELVGRGDVLLAQQCGATLADIETLLGRPASALRMLDTIKVGGQPVGASTPGALSLARAHVVLMDPEGADRALRPVLATATEPAPTRPALVDALVIEAAVAQLRGQEGRTVESLARAVSMSNGELLLPFALSGGHFADVIRRHPALAASWPVPLEDPAGGGRPDAAEAARRSAESGSAMPEPLTDRESAILQWLATPMSTAEIADKLYVSVNTVKTHVAAIYRKLPATGRRDAIRRARELELL